MYVMDETWDMWYSRKTKHDYALDFDGNYQFDIQAMVEKDYNHPCVIMYSIGNEVAEPATEKGVKLAKELADYLRSLDSTRAVTAGLNLMIINSSSKGKGFYKDGEQKQQDMSGMNSTMFNLITSFVGTGMNKSANSKHADRVTSPVLSVLDICGYNYSSGRYPLEAKAHSERIVVGSETFPQDIVKNWAMVKKYPYLIGDFMWTAWDYLGECGVGAWAYTSDGKRFDKPYPWLLADCGALDILGNPNGEVFLAQAAWGLLDNPVICVRPVNHKGVKPAKMVWRGTNALPSWSWKNCDGEKAVVEVYSDAAYIELLINSKSRGKKKVRFCKATFKARYQSGRIEAVSFNSEGKETGRSIIRSAAGSLRIHIIHERSDAKPGDILYIPILIADKDGTIESNADERVAISVENGELLAFGSANPRTEENFLSGAYSTYYGHALAVIRLGATGETLITAKGTTLETASARIQISS
jgi:hypothetical protein